MSIPMSEQAAISPRCIVLGTGGTQSRCGDRTGSEGYQSWQVKALQRVVLQFIRQKRRTSAKN